MDFERNPKVPSSKHYITVEKGKRDQCVDMAFEIRNVHVILIDWLIPEDSVQFHMQLVLRHSNDRTPNIPQIVLLKRFKHPGQFPPPLAQNLRLFVGIGNGDLLTDSPQLNSTHGVKCKPATIRGQPIKLRNIKRIWLSPNIRGMVVATDVGEQHEECPHKQDQYQKACQAAHFLQ